MILVPTTSGDIEVDGIVDFNQILTIKVPIQPDQWLSAITFKYHITCPFYEDSSQFSVTRPTRFYPSLNVESLALTNMDSRSIYAVADYHQQIMRPCPEPVLFLCSPDHPITYAVETRRDQSQPWGLLVLETTFRFPERSTVSDLVAWKFHIGPMIELFQTYNENDPPMLQQMHVDACYTEDDRDCS